MNHSMANTWKIYVSENVTHDVQVVNKEILEL